MRRLLLLVLLVVLAGSAEARPLKGSGPQTLAVGYGAAWVGFGDGTVTRIDARTRRRVSRRVGNGAIGYSITSFATGFGSVWAATSSFPVHRLDPRTAAVRAVISNQPGRWSGGGSEVATGAGFVWVADFQRNAILRVNPRTNRVGRRRGLRDRIRSLAGGSAAVWVQTVPGRAGVSGPHGPRVVSRLDPRTLRLRAVLRLECDARLTAAGRILWVLDTCSGGLRRVDRTVSAPIETVPQARGLAVGFGSVWVTDGAAVHRIVGDRVVTRIGARGHVLAVGAGRVWLLDLGNGAAVGWLRLIDPATNRLVGRPIRLARRT